MNKYTPSIVASTVIAGALLLCFVFAFVSASVVLCGVVGLLFTVTIPNATCPACGGHVRIPGLGRMTVAHKVVNNFQCNHCGRVTAIFLYREI